MSTISVLCMPSSGTRFIMLHLCILRKPGISTFYEQFQFKNSEKQCSHLHVQKLLSLCLSYYTPKWAHIMVVKRSRHPPENPKLKWHTARLIKEGGCVDLSMDNMYLKDPLVIFGSEGSALTLPLFLLPPRIIMLCQCSSTMIKDHFSLILHGTK